MTKSSTASLVAMPVRSGNRVIGVIVETVIVFDDCGRATFCGNGVTSHRVDLGDHGETELGVGFRDGDRCAQTSAATANDEHIVGENVHQGRKGMREVEFCQAFDVSAHHY